MKKPFKETKIGQFLKEKAPKILDKIADVLPDKGGLGILKNIIDTDDSISLEDKAQAKELLEQELKMYELEIEDRKSARLREIEYVKANKSDWMMIGVGSIGLLAFILLVCAVLFKPELYNDNPVVMHLMGIIEGVAITIFMYYFGSSKGSKDKTNLLGK